LYQPNTGLLDSVVLNSTCSWHPSVTTPSNCSCQQGAVQIVADWPGM